MFQQFGKPGQNLKGRIYPICGNLMYNLPGIASGNIQQQRRRATITASAQR
ncbi:hypothetical protein [Burkholderia lata]|uniref:hypothetical protein n=1 Tax=Burkholderia lata (strain ATCC 17760 / DSM 23089 / LMG 22485 / NCIMB 9086 / R18194 / 383) TaxID=482957 RepID=UPI001583809B|nr:hypothetical protein [Burkholderia lata]